MLRIRNCYSPVLLANFVVGNFCLSRVAVISKPKKHVLKRFLLAPAPSPSSSGASDEVLPKESSILEKNNKNNTVKLYLYSLNRLSTEPQEEQQEEETKIKSSTLRHIPIVLRLHQKNQGEKNEDENGEAKSKIILHQLMSEKDFDFLASSSSSPCSSSHDIQITLPRSFPSSQSPAIRESLGRTGMVGRQNIKMFNKKSVSSSVAKTSLFALETQLLPENVADEVSKDQNKSDSENVDVDTYNEGVEMKRFWLREAKEARATLDEDSFCKWLDKTLSYIAIVSVMTQRASQRLEEIKKKQELNRNNLQEEENEGERQKKLLYEESLLTLFGSISKVAQTEVEVPLRKLSDELKEELVMRSFTNVPLASAREVRNNYFDFMLELQELASSVLSEHLQWASSSTTTTSSGSAATDDFARKRRRMLERRALRNLAIRCLEEEGTRKESDGVLLQSVVFPSLSSSSSNSNSSSLPCPDYYLKEASVTANFIHVESQTILPYTVSLSFFDQFYSSSGILSSLFSSSSPSSSLPPPTTHEEMWKRLDLLLPVRNFSFAETFDLDPRTKLIGFSIQTPSSSCSNDSSSSSSSSEQLSKLPPSSLRYISEVDYAAASFHLLDTAQLSSFSPHSSTSYSSSSSSAYQTSVFLPLAVHPLSTAHSSFFRRNPAVRRALSFFFTGNQQSFSEHQFRAYCSLFGELFSVENPYWIFALESFKNVMLLLNDNFLERDLKRKKYEKKMKKKKEQKRQELLLSSLEKNSDNNNEEKDNNQQQDQKKQKKEEEKEEKEEGEEEEEAFSNVHDNLRELQLQEAEATSYVFSDRYYQPLSLVDLLVNIFENTQQNRIGAWDSISVCLVAPQHVWERAIHRRKKDEEASSNSSSSSTTNPQEIFEFKKTCFSNAFFRLALDNAVSVLRYGEVGSTHEIRSLRFDKSSNLKSSSPHTRLPFEKSMPLSGEQFEKVASRILQVADHFFSTTPSSTGSDGSLALSRYLELKKNPDAFFQQNEEKNKNKSNGNFSLFKEFTSSSSSSSLLASLYQAACASAALRLGKFKDGEALKATETLQRFERVREYHNVRKTIQENENANLKLEGGGHQKEQEEGKILLTANSEQQRGVEVKVTNQSEAANAVSVVTSPSSSSPFVTPAPATTSASSSSFLCFDSLLPPFRFNKNARQNLDHIFASCRKNEFRNADCFRRAIFDSVFSDIQKQVLKTLSLCGFPVSAPSLNNVASSSSTTDSFDNLFHALRQNSEIVVPKLRWNDNNDDNNDTKKTKNNNNKKKKNLEIQKQKQQVRKVFNIGLPKNALSFPCSPSFLHPLSNREFRSSYSRIRIGLSRFAPPEQMHEREADLARQLVDFIAQLQQQELEGKRMGGEENQVQKEKDQAVLDSSSSSSSSSSSFSSEKSTALQKEQKLQSIEIELKSNVTTKPRRETTVRSAEELMWHSTNIGQPFHRINYFTSALVENDNNNFGDNKEKSEESVKLDHVKINELKELLTPLSEFHKEISFENMKM